MHLIRNIEDFIEDLDRLVTYEFSEELELDDDDEETTIPQVMAHRWDTNTRTLLAANESAKPFWAYLESLLKFDATQAQDAPPERYAIGSYVYVSHTAKCVEARWLHGRITEIVEDPDDVRKETFWYVLDFHPQRKFPGTPAFEHDEIKPVNSKQKRPE